MKINTQRGIAPIIVMLLVVAVAGGGTYAVKKSNSNKVKIEQSAKVQATSTVATSTTSNVAATSSAKTLQITLNEQNKSGQSGKVVITEVNGKAKVIVNLTGKPSSTPQPSHIHLNSCSNIGAVKYELTNVGNGASQTMIDVSLDELLTQLPLSINVHKSAAEAGVYVACGDFSTSTPKASATSTIKVDAKVKVQ